MPASPELSYNLLLLADLRELALSFEQRQISYFVMKGIPLTWRVFGRLDARTMIDNDIVVAEADVDRAYGALLEMGFRDLAHSLEASRRATFQHTMYRRHRTEYDTQLELHWSAASPVLFRNGEAFFSEVEFIEHNGVRLPTLNPTATVVHLVTHWLQHGMAKASILRDLGAAWDKCRDAIEPQRVHALACGIGAETCLGAAFFAATAAGHCHRPWPKSWLTGRVRLLLSAVDTGSSADGGVPSYAQTLRSWAFLDGRAIARAVRAELWPPIQRMRYIYGENATRRELCAAYVRRPLGALMGRRYRPHR